MTLKIITLYTIISFCWGITWLFLKINVTQMPILWGLSLRFIIAGIIFWFIYFLKKDKVKFNPQIQSIYIVYTLFNYTFCYYLTYWGAQYIYSNLGSILYSLSPITIAIMAHFFIPDDKLNKKKIMSMMIGFIGTILLLYNGNSFGGEKVFLGISAILLAIVIGSWPTIYIKKQGIKVDPIHLNAVGLSIAGLIILLMALIFDRSSFFQISSNNILTLLFLAIPGTVVTWGIYIWLLNHLPASQLSYVAFFPPIIAIISGWLFLNETLSLISLFGATLIILGGFLINFDIKHT
ncbi:MAG: DMT family transporter [Fidelibacterota bacterium]|jgi:drug/metabolite transporter (DMT)-like permease|tara:strand:- start:212 stop:1090 length:879 start_codon:yes stop_codon:yes gene_type:complete